MTEYEEYIYVLKEFKEQHQERLMHRSLTTNLLCEYAQDIFYSMMEQEGRRFPILFMSSHIKDRPHLLQFCETLTKQYSLNRVVLHLAIYYLDRFIDRFTIRQDKLNLVAIVSIHLASQMENSDAYVPRYSDMNSLVNYCYTAFEFKAVERKILCFFDFELIRPTTASFVELFSDSFLTEEDYIAYSQMLVEDNQHVQGRQHAAYASLQQMITYLAELLLRMADYTLRINRFGNVPPSLLAASCIASVRQVSGVPQRWTLYLTDLTSYTEPELQSYADIITIYHYYYSANNPEDQISTPVSQYQPQDELKHWSSPDSGFDDYLSVSHDGAATIIDIQLLGEPIGTVEKNVSVPQDGVATVVDIQILKEPLRIVKRSVSVPQDDVSTVVDIQILSEPVKRKLDTVNDDIGGEQQAAKRQKLN
ncbi:cyclin-J [Scaptodrosophila lebanonensis]|uniref:Cyclin-J n=1 Tax=Drosophila lebanonensis TaxID=7225 RepID=A0A6J2UBR3_DROLE|nr:cyclin-J [Scaptodrosophila lebanonensis]